MTVESRSVFVDLVEQNTVQCVRCKEDVKYKGPSLLSQTPIAMLQNRHQDLFSAFRDRIEIGQNDMPGHSGCPIRRHS